MEHKIEYYQIAQIQLEKAISLYLDHISLENHLCAIVLAGNAENLLGKMIKSIDKSHILDSVLSDLQNEHDFDKSKTISILNFARDSLKHLQDFENPAREFIEFKPSAEASSMILRAIINYKVLTDYITQQMADFLNHYFNNEAPE